MTALHPEHPDASVKPGDKRKDAFGREWTFGINQYSHFWRAGPKDGTITCSKDFPNIPGPYRAGGVVCEEFSRAAARSRTNAEAEYKRAKAIVDRYEAAE